MGEHYVREDVQAFFDLMKNYPRPEFTTEMLPQIRAMSAQGGSMLDLPVGELAVVRDLTMPGPGGEIALRLFDARTEREPGPVIVFYHGGGFVLGSIDTHAGIAAELARGLDLPVVSVEYRLAPDHPWPAAPDDGEAAARWIAENGAAFDRTFTSLILCGDSAGANLTIVTAMALRDVPASLPVILQLPFYPAVDPMRSDYESKRAFSEGYQLDAKNMAWFNEMYRSAPGHWRGSPLHGDLRGLPPMLLATAALDPLRDEGRSFAAKAIEAGVQTTYREFAGTIHGFLSYRRMIPSAQKDMAELIAAARAMLAEFGG